MSEIVERVAKAINPYAWNDVWPESRKGEREPLKGRAMYAARAAIEAMRSPTEAMERAGLRENTIQGAAIWATPSWQAMIDVALSEKSK
jgi:hypothetical protein